MAVRDTSSTKGHIHELQQTTEYSKRELESEHKFNQTPERDA